MKIPLENSIDEFYLFFCRMFSTIIFYSDRNIGNVLQSIAMLTNYQCWLIIDVDCEWHLEKKNRPKLSSRIIIRKSTAQTYCIHGKALLVMASNSESTIGSNSSFVSSTLQNMESA